MIPVFFVRVEAGIGEEAVMSEFKHLVIVKFKEGVVVEDIIKGMEKLVSEIDVVKSFEWLVIISSLFYSLSSFNLYIISTTCAVITTPCNII